MAECTVHFKATDRWLEGNDEAVGVATSNSSFGLVPSAMSYPRLPTQESKFSFALKVESQTMTSKLSYPREIETSPFEAASATVNSQVVHVLLLCPLQNEARHRMQLQSCISSARSDLHQTEQTGIDLERAS